MVVIHTNSCHNLTRANAAPLICFALRLDLSPRHLLLSFVHSHGNPLMLAVHRNAQGRRVVGKASEGDSACVASDRQIPQTSMAHRHRLAPPSTVRVPAAMYPTRPSEESDGGCRRR